MNGDRHYGDCKFVVLFEYRFLEGRKRWQLQLEW